MERLRGWKVIVGASTSCCAHDRTAELLTFGLQPDRRYLVALRAASLWCSQTFLSLQPTTTLQEARDLLNLPTMGCFAKNNVLDALANLGSFTWSNEFFGGKR